MFEDSTFESAGRIRTRSRRWMIAAFAFYASILLALVLVPLICPEALSGHGVSIAIAVPLAPAHPETPKPPPPRAAVIHPEFTGTITAPSTIPRVIVIPTVPDAPIATSPVAYGPGVPGGRDDPFGPRPAPRVVHPDAPPRLRVSTMVEEGLLVSKKMPVYPPIAIAVRAEGTVTLAATISKSGTIENLRVLGGPPLLQQAALDAVSAWRYRPYLLDGQPVEVETTVNVVFNLDR